MVTLDISQIAIFFFPFVDFNWWSSDLDSFLLVNTLQNPLSCQTCEVKLHRNEKEKAHSN